MPEDFAESWAKTRDEIEARAQRLISELDCAWRELEALSQDLTKRFRLMAIPDVKPDSVESLQFLFGELGLGFLLDPL